LPRNIGVTLHPNALSGEHAGLNRQLARLAKQLRDMTGATLHGVTVWRAYGETLLRRRIPHEELTRYRDETRERAEFTSRTALIGEDEVDTNVQLHVVEGDLLRRIPEVVAEQSIDLLIAGNLARCGLPGFVVGNTVERLLPRVECSVLAVPANVPADARAA
jgi:nucleotide-binding universal stress UspA family protein